MIIRIGVVNSIKKIIRSFEFFSSVLQIFSQFSFHAIGLVIERVCWKWRTGKCQTKSGVKSERKKWRTGKWRTESAGPSTWVEK